MSTPSSAIVDDNAANATVYAARSVSWDKTTLSNGTVIPAGVIFADAVLEERHDDESVITENPVEDGSTTNDHAYDLQQECELTYVWSPSGSHSDGQPSYLDNVYKQFLTLKQAKILLHVVTGKRTYDNMLVKHIGEVTDKDTENILMLRISLRELLLTFTQTVSISSANQQSMPEKTAPTINSGSASLQPGNNFNMAAAPAGTDTTATPYSLPLKPTNQTLSVMMGGVQRQVTMRWNQMNAAWTCDIANASGGAVISGLPVVTGCDLLAPYAHLNLGGQLIAQTTNNANAVPTLANLGATGNLYFLPKP